LAGGVIEADYAAELQAVVKGYPFASWLGEIAFERMSSLYDAAHVVLNCSLTEGGMANSLLEGMAHGRPVLASDIEGNRALVRDGENGFLFRGERDFLAKAELLLSDKGMRKRMGLAGRQLVSKYCSPSVEAERYLSLYYSAVAAYDGP
jgi:glycosyltransferase involved in cell wall biosynthesis